MKNYLDLAQKILDHGSDRMDRTGVGCRSLFGEQLRFDLTKGFPLVTTKKVFWKGVVAELLWMLSGSTNVKPLQAQGVHIWDEWARPNGDLGPVYGKQWRAWSDYGYYDHPMDTDQIVELVESLKTNPGGRRHIVSAWNVQELDEMALPPCHMMFQCFVTPARDIFGNAEADRKPRLSLVLHQRSADYFLGVPFNIASYALLTHMLAHACSYQVGEFIHNFGDVHLYHNHFDQIKEQLTRQPRALPRLSLNQGVTKIDDFKLEDILLIGYDPLPAIKAEVAI